MGNIITKIINLIKGRKTKQALLDAPRGKQYDEGVNTVVMKKSTLDNLKVDMTKMNKKVKLDNGFISVYDLTDEEIEDMIQLYTDELSNINRQIKATQLEIEKLKKKNGVE